jgi:DNA-binding transcriptional MerR regulator
MRVAELADLADTTVRTIRHYHAIGLLPVPSKRDGWRDYDLSHVARLSRIRWLAEAGVPLGTIGDLLAAGPGNPDGSHRREGILTDLRATLAAVDERLGVVAAQRDRLGRLVDSVGSGSALTPMSPAAVDFYGRLEAAATTERARRAIREERSFVELAYYRGELPPEAELLFATLDEAGVQESVAAFGRDPEVTLTDAEIDELAAAVVARMMSKLSPDVAGIATAIDLEAVRRAYALFARTVIGQERRIAEAVFRRLEAVILRERSS